MLVQPTSGSVSPKKEDLRGFEPKALADSSKSLRVIFLSGLTHPLPPPVIGLDD